MTAPDSDIEDRVDPGPGWTKEQLEAAYYKKNLHAFLIQNPVMLVLRPRVLDDLKGPVSKPITGSSKLDVVKTLLQLLKESGIIAGAFEADELFDLKLGAIEHALKTLYETLKPLVGTISQPTKEIVRSQPTLAPDDQTGKSSHYESATEEVDSDSVGDPPGMTLGPSGAAMLRDRADRAEREAVPSAQETKIAVVNPTRHSPERLESYFQSVMGRFLKEQQSTPRPRVARQTGDQEVVMESAGSPDHHSSPWEYDRDDLDLTTTTRAAVAATATAQAGRSTAAPRIRVSAMSEEIHWKEGDEGQARTWIGKVKSAFIRDQAPDDEKCLVFGDLLTGPARNWYRQLSRTARSTWKDLLLSFQTQYCGPGVSVARQYYHARKRSDESPLEYLHRLNVAGLRARLQVKDGSPETRREDVDHFIETLDDRDLADHLALLRIPDADTLEETLRSRQRAKARQSKNVYGSIKPRTRAPTAATPSAPTRAVRAIHVADDSSESEVESSGSDGEAGLRRMYLTAAGNRGEPQDRRPPDQDRDRTGSTNRNHQQDRHTRSTDLGTSFKRCSHCGSRMHTDLGYWERLTCEKCGRKRHPSDWCFLCARPAVRSTTLANARWRSSTT